MVKRRNKIAGVDLTGVSHIGIRVHELARARAFYELLGFKFVIGPVGPEPVAILSHPAGVDTLGHITGEVVRRVTGKSIGRFVRDEISYVRDIHSSGRHLHDLVGDILDLAKIESGKDEPQETLIDVPRLLGAVLPLVKGRADAGGVKLGTDSPDGLPRLRADSRKLKQILVNLLSNGIKFTEPGGSVRLSVSVRNDDGISFQVVDTGVGMAERDIPTALSQFGQVENKLGRDHEGTGIGLPLSRALVEQHGGTLVLASEVGAGTTVTAEFPAERTVRGPENETQRSLRQNANPSEMRRIVFTHDEVLVALSRYAAEPNGRQKDSRFVYCRILRSPKLRVLAGLESHAGGTVQEIEVSARDVAEALLRYCAASGVPIPLRADKELEVIGENLSLNLRIETAVEPVIGRVGGRK